MYNKTSMIITVLRLSKILMRLETIMIILLSIYYLLIPRNFQAPNINNMFVITKLFWRLDNLEDSKLIHIIILNYKLL